MNISEAKIRTFARVRPFNNAELECEIARHSVVRCIGEKSLVFNPSSLRQVAPVVRFSTARGRQHYNQKYEFSGVFGPETQEDDLYEKVAFPLLNSALKGNNSSMFAYGATGCGKSHTISAIQDRLSRDIIKCMQQNEDILSLKMTYLQLYNEKLIDLIPKPGSTQNLDMRDAHGNGVVSISGLSEHYPQSEEHIRELFAIGNRNRVIATTQANAGSSRSHAVLTFHIESRSATTGHSQHSTLSIIDLAGSERAQSTKNRGMRLNEGAKINKSLLALGNCITARAQKRRFIPYRESKLTRLLRFSLEGNCETAMVVCVSPSLKHFDETRNSLEYGKRAALISQSALNTASNGTIRRQNIINDLEEQVNKLTLWKRDVAEALHSKIPELYSRLSVKGGITNISASDFVEAIRESQGDIKGSVEYSELRYQSPSRQNQQGGRNSLANESLMDCSMSHQPSLYSTTPNVLAKETYSPLKRSRRNVSAMVSRESILTSPHTVKRLHV